MMVESGYSICEIEGEHAKYSVSETIIEGYLYQISCPRCGAFALLTQTDIEDAIIEALSQEGIYSDIECISPC
ncbi:hypothetical protein LCGC14_3026400 [marine sediment metagenome]|uniref:Uncharacterized protein n=1 Tax=marine sediment metagenome TaxID=412755 RepID=A0A0F8WTK4_9ZZZZ